ncbi:MAG: chloramphenicol phosphotransferase [Acidimicrobiia bacterium]
MFLLTGFPGTGKLTVGTALRDLLEADGETVRVVDNHWINNPILGLIDQDGITPLPQGVWERVGEVADAVIRTAEEFTPPSWQLIFTAYLDGVTDTGWVPRLERLASARGAIVVPVRLLCDPEEIARRIVSSERRKRMKSADPEEPHRLATAGPPYDPGHPNTLTLDITAMAPDEAAAQILAHAESVGRASGQWPTANG